MKIARLKPDGFWPTPDVQRGWWHGIYLSVGPLHLKLRWHREQNRDTKGSE